MDHADLQQMFEAYALGALDAEEHRLFESHLESGCAECAKKLSEFTPVIAALAMSIEAVAPSPELKRKTLEALQQTHFFSLRSSEGQWQAISPGITRKILFADNQNQRTTMLIRMAAGSQLFSHRHAGAEELFILEGDCVAQGGRLNAGDYHRAEGGSTHGATTTENGCLMLVISPEIEIVV
jgi:anti-sigma factor ChrR (cupin superfamily)